MKTLMLEDIKKKLTGYDKLEIQSGFAEYTEYTRSDGYNGRGNLSEDTITKYPEEMFIFFETLCFILPDNVTLDDFLFNMELLIKDLEKEKCGFHNNSNIKKSFDRLNMRFKTFGNLPQTLTYIPRYIDDIADTEFSIEFSRRFGEEILGEYGIEAQKQDYGYIEIKKDEIDISNKDKAEVLAELYNNSRPIGMGIVQYDPTPMTIEIARKILEQKQDFDYLRGRPLKINLEGNIIYVGKYNMDNAQGLAQKVISSCRNINEIGVNSLNKVETKVEEEIQKQIQEELVQKHKEVLEQQENNVNNLSTKNRGLDYLRVPQSELQPIRRLIEESGLDITNETIEFIKNIENKVYPEEMKIMQDAEDIEDLSDIYEYFESEITIVRNKDWYIVYGEDEDSVEILDIASSPTRDIEASRKEMHNYLIGVINKKAKDDNKPVILNAKEDTSYRMIQRMVNNGEYEIVEDTVNSWETDDSIIMHNLVLNPIIERDKERE
jgi:hypothetical protein